MSMNHTVYPVGNFKFGTKAAKEVKYPTVDAQMERLQTKYQAEGPRRSVDAVLVVHQVSPLPIRYLRASRKIIIVAFGIGANRVVSLSLLPKHRTTTRIFCCYRRVRPTSNCPGAGSGPARR